MGTKAGGTRRWMISLHATTPKTAWSCTRGRNSTERTPGIILIIITWSIQHYMAMRYFFPRNLCTAIMMAGPGPVWRIFGTLSSTTHTGQGDLFGYLPTAV